MAFEASPPVGNIAEELLFGRPETLKVFVSSKMRGGVLRRERRAVVEEVEATKLAKAWFWERDSFAGPFCSLAVCVGHAKTSDFLFLILVDELTDTTRAEYEAAHAAGASCAVLVRDGASRNAEAQEFLDREQVKNISKTYRNLSELRTEALRGLRGVVTHDVRMGIVDRRAPA